MKNTAAAKAARMDSVIMIKKPHGVCPKGTTTFIPQKVPSIVGIERIIVIAAKNFIITLTLLLMIDAKQIGRAHV